MDIKYSTPPNTPTSQNHQVEQPSRLRTSMRSILCLLLLGGVYNVVFFGPHYEDIEDNPLFFRICQILSATMMMSLSHMIRKKFDDSFSVFLSIVGAVASGTTFFIMMTIAIYAPEDTYSTIRESPAFPAMYAMYFLPLKAIPFYLILSEVNNNVRELLM